MPRICTCGHSYTQHRDKMCDYSGYSCKCVGYKPEPTRSRNPNDYPGRFPEKKSIVVDKDKLAEYLKGLVESGAVTSLTATVPEQGDLLKALQALRSLTPKEEA